MDSEEQRVTKAILAMLGSGDCMCHLSRELGVEGSFIVNIALKLEKAGKIRIARIDTCMYFNSVR